MHPKRVIIFGPPGCGKSTIIKAISTAAIDVEDLGQTYEERKNNFLKKVSTERNITYYGGADLQMSDLPEGSLTVLVCPSDFEIYKTRFETRNKNNPHKAGQNEQNVYEWFYSNRDKFDIYIDNKQSLEQTMQDLSNELLKKGLIS